MNSAKTFNCSATCEGMHADIQWQGNDIEDEIGEMHDLDTESMDNFEEAQVKLLKRVAQLEREVKMLKSGFGNTWEDLEKYKMLITEYRKFKAKNMKHFRFKDDSNSGTVGEIFCLPLMHNFIFKFRRGATTFKHSAC